MEWKIGDVSIANRVVLAPMAGISTPAFMRIAEEMGASLAFTELLSSEAIIRDSAKTFAMLDGIEDVKIPIGIQLFGNDAEVMKRAAQIVCSTYNVAIIDINMGCPVPKVAIRAKSGSALLKNPQKVYEIVKKVKEGIDRPVTVKIRSGWDDLSINAVEISRICESAGASAITVHARTRSQGYSGHADWNIIKDVVANVSIPVIGNGDITSPELAKKMLKDTGCTAIMVGRGALGNPWLLKNIVQYLKIGKYESPPTEKEKIAMIRKHYELLKKYKPEKVALLEIRTNALWYLKGLPGSAQLKNKICNTSSNEEILNLLDEFYTGL